MPSTVLGLGRKFERSLESLQKKQAIQPFTQESVDGDIWQRMPKVFLPYQVKFLTNSSSVRISRKSRRVGMSWAVAGDCALDAAKRKGMSTTYLGYDRLMTQQFIHDAASWAKAYNLASSEISEFVFEDEDEDILGFRLNFASGNYITALSSKPRNLRSRGCRVVLDEFAFHDAPQELLKAGVALLMWKGRIDIISSVNGKCPYFERLCTGIAEERGYYVQETTLDDALADGLYQRICLVNGREWSPEAQERWRSQLVKEYGIDANEELFCIPNKGKNGIINPEWLQRYDCPPAEPEAIVISVDSAAKAREVNDPWALTVWAIWQGKFYLIDCVIRRMDYPTGKRAIVSLCQKHADPIGIIPLTVLIEDKSTGQALIPELRSNPSMCGAAVIPINPVADKVTRLSIETPAFEAGQVYLPNTAPWLPEYESALLSFPNGIADPADSTSQFLAWARGWIRRRSSSNEAQSIGRSRFAEIKGDRGGWGSVGSSLDLRGY